MTREKNEDLQIILNEMFASKEKLSLRDVIFWQKKYPNFKREIIEAYTDWRDFEFFVLEDEESSIIESQVSDENKKAISDLLAQFRTPSIEAITDLRELAERKKVSRESLRKIVGGSETLLKRFERRHLKEIKKSIIEKFAELLTVSTESLQAFFDLPPTLSPAARYKSKNAPQTQPKQTFAEAVENDPELSDEEKRKLLELK